MQTLYPGGLRSDSPFFLSFFPSFIFLPPLLSFSITFFVLHLPVPLFWASGRALGLNYIQGWVGQVDFHTSHTASTYISRRDFDA